MSVIQNIIELWEIGHTVERIAELTGYPIEDIKKTISNWKNQIKTK